MYSQEYNFDRDTYSFLQLPLESTTGSTFEEMTRLFDLIFAGSPKLSVRCVNTRCQIHPQFPARLSRVLLSTQRSFQVFSRPWRMHTDRLAKIVGQRRGLAAITEYNTRRVGGYRARPRTLSYSKNRGACLDGRVIDCHSSWQIQAIEF